MAHIIVTGPESTGKTTLVAALAARHGGLPIPEYPRGYLEALGRLAEPADFPHFARVNVQLAAAALAQSRRSREAPLVLQDTGAEVLALWYEDKFGDRPDYLRDALRAQRPDAYLLCRPDLPWEYDPLREDPHRRQELFTRLRGILDETGARVVEVAGFDDAREAEATASLERLRLVAPAA